ncbi:hypothetical protein Fa020709_067 [Synechococcus phage S-RIM2]|uniref:Uncharacterized protein n=3 Tax=Nerrivikvirus srim2 TaxID=2734125 RepID=A0A1D7R9D8_9CAUD|nr:hypothetical protein SWRG_00055 [Synechococcus phage S-RIM2 R21_2007]AGH06960.1 hypothetical protein SWUG_00050 [Synechococcus phage S-RIM2 R9_2006]AON97580.1 hypothetical protein Fa020709_067 [Synechococcus phage S-RIM2]AON98008.1 hypothetical protein Fa240709_067 [Synechococcus phage S-RIM2]AOO03789.1 hypothetical protein RW010709_067 [Synechococcus phage S-RIM2]
MLFKGPNGRTCSTLSGPEILALSNTDEFIENCREVAKITGNVDLFAEMFGDERGQDSAFMDDTFGG